MKDIHPGRFTAAIDGDFVVFLIGMRINRLRKLRSWVPVAKAMPRMQKELAQHPELGCLGAANWFGRTTVSVQYWRDFDSLNSFARNPDQTHLPAWRAFNKAINNSGDVGIWHETYQVHQGSTEAVYGNMPVFGLAAAFDHVPVAARGQTAAERINATDDDVTAVDPY
ncbi:MAG: hypothetical protein FD127_3701 [Acidimicrobiaceae bacterium]|nr:MAG: hypothetical protein FD127_3701 [Acidimicrobiaceae bacterium]